MAKENKTQENDASVEDFLAWGTTERRKQVSLALVDLFRRVTGLEPKMWGTSIVGFGRYRYVYDSGRAGDFPMTGFSPRKAALSIYVMSGFSNHEALLARLGKHKTGKACLYVNKLDDIDLGVLEQLVRAEIAHMTSKYGA